MHSSPREKTSLRKQLVLIVLFCWVLPIVILVGAEGILLNNDFERSVRQEMELTGSHAIEQTTARFENLFEESKTVSYDGVVRNAYRSYQLGNDSAALYRTVSSYLSQRFSRTQFVRAMFLTFWNERDIHPYMSNQPDDRSRTLLTQYSEIEDDILDAMREADTQIIMTLREDRLYIARNLLDSHLRPYATVVILCDAAYFSEPLLSLRYIGTVCGVIDERIRYEADGSLALLSEESTEDRNVVRFDAASAGHTFSICVRMRSLDILSELPDLRLALYGVLFLIVPLLIALFVIFSRQVARPVQTLVAATSRIQQGERGYVIEEEAASQEFHTLYQHFNAMSTEMKKQFELAVEEQQALQQARIKALQSQINPHFLNNTLEVINWEARIAGNDRISAMIEALATMLRATLNRDGAGRIPLREELEYVDAYLYITKERMGDRLQTQYDIDEALMDQLLPRLILQPVVENAVEHDLSRVPAGKLVIRAYRQADKFFLEVEHNGSMSEEDKRNIEKLLGTEAETPASRSHIGIRNVNQRLRLLYGQESGLSIRETETGTILAVLSFPI